MDLSDWLHRSFKTRFRTKAHPDVFGLCVWDTMPGSCNKAVCDQCAGAKWVTVDICQVYDGEDLVRGKRSCLGSRVAIDDSRLLGLGKKCFKT